MNIPDDLRYSSDHEWVRSEDGLVRIGITDYAQDALGDVVFVEVPEVGTSVDARDKVSEVESTKSVSDIYAPIGGTMRCLPIGRGTAPNFKIWLRAPLMNCVGFSAGLLAIWAARGCDGGASALMTSFPTTETIPVAIDRPEIPPTDQLIMPADVAEARPVDKASA